MERERLELQRVLVGEISKGMEQVKEVKASCSERVLETMLASYRDALSILTGTTPDEESRSVITSSLDPPGLKRRRKATQLMTKVCDDDDDDGHSWRKYGQKPIRPSNNIIREYYKCSSRGCPARKQVQKSDDDSSKTVVTYTGMHTCVETVAEPRLASLGLGKQIF